MSEIVSDLNTLKDSISQKLDEIRGHEIILGQAKKELEGLQEKCSHPNKESQSEYDFTAHWCNDCGKEWSTRR